MTAATSSPALPAPSWSARIADRPSEPRPQRHQAVSPACQAGDFEDHAASRVLSVVPRWRPPPYACLPALGRINEDCHHDRSFNRPRRSDAQTGALFDRDGVIIMMTKAQWELTPASAGLPNAGDEGESWCAAAISEESQAWRLERGRSDPLRWS
jgi:hypothetical protein